MRFIKSCRRWLALALFAGIFIPASAVPARKGLVTVRQSDGTELKVQIVGDEFSHYYISEDGYPLVNEDDTFYYATVDDDGKIVSSAIVARSVESRSAEVNGFLGRIDREKVVSAIRARDNVTRKNNARRTASSPQRSKVGLFDTGFPATGDQKGLVILVEYRDVKFTLDNPHDYFSRMLNEDGFSDYGGTGCAAEYFRESSMGQFRPVFDVYGPVSIIGNMRDYGGNDSNGNDKNPQKMAIEACMLLDDEIDFTQYDRDGDGVIDNVFIFYAGRGEATGGGANTVWPHSWYVTAAELTPYYFDGVQLDRYACSNEWVDDRPDGAGTFVHEFSHVMGLPDLYPTEYTGAFTPGTWSVLDAGPYNNDGCTPPLYSVYERFSLGWMTPTVLDGPADIELADIGNNVGYIIPTDNPNEFFLLENRQQKSWDEFIPGHGMLVWHIDYDANVWEDNVVNNDPAHQYVDLEEADGTQTDFSRSGDAFPGTKNVTSFTGETRPAMVTWDGTAIDMPITEIAETDGIITFKVAGGTVDNGILQAREDGAGVRMAGRWLLIDAEAGDGIEVADMAGRMIYSSCSDGNTVSVALPGRGMYVVKAGDRCFKMMR